MIWSHIAELLLYRYATQIYVVSYGKYEIHNTLYTLLNTTFGSKVQ